MGGLPLGAFSPFHFIILAVVFAFYMAPGIIALARDHPHRIAIVLVNFFLGWSGVAWIASLIWALVSPRRPTAI